MFIGSRKIKPNKTSVIFFFLQVNLLSRGVRRKFFLDFLTDRNHLSLKPLARIRPSTSQSNASNLQKATEQINTGRLFCIGMTLGIPRNATLKLEGSTDFSKVFS